MASRLKIVVGGYIVGYPLGGMTWHHLNYLLGLVDLGHDVIFLEDGADLPPYDPAAFTSGDPTYGLNYLRQTFDSVGLNIPFHYRYGPNAWGLSIDDMDAALKSADLFIAVSGVTPVAWRPRARRNLVIDTDPVFTQLRMRQDAAFLDYYRWFDAVGTFGKLIGTPASPLPTHGLKWIGTNQPIHLPAWPVKPLPAGAAFTTIGKWEHSAERHVEFEGGRYLSSKGVEWVRLLDLPRRVPARYELAMASIDGPTQARFESHGWAFTDATAASISTGAFAAFVGRSVGELTVAKQIYAGLPSGWFSDRSSCYLATGRPVVTQCSGFERWLPTGEGLFAFAGLDDAAGAVSTILTDPERHARAARAIAERHLDARKVLAELILQVV
jgi:hypothetical protein